MVHSELIEIAKDYAVRCHEITNHKYDGQPYCTHLQMVYDFGCKYATLLNPEEVDFALAGCWVHDTIEDCRQTYNDVKKVCGERVAEIAYALTNEKGKNREERANEKYYAEIRIIPAAHYVKICDRLANTKYSIDKNTRMAEIYKNELPEFQKKLWSIEFQIMFDELSALSK